MLRTAVSVAATIRNRLKTLVFIASRRTKGSCCTRQDLHVRGRRRNRGLGGVRPRKRRGRAPRGRFARTTGLTCQTTGVSDEGTTGRTEGGRGPNRFETDQG